MRFVDGLTVWPPPVRRAPASVRTPDWARIQRALAKTAFPEPFTMTAFVAAVAEQRGRRIELIATRAPAGPCGLLVATPTADYIIYDGSSSLHRDHTIAHELGHLVLEHPLAVIEYSDRTAADRLSRAVVPYTADDEHDADLFAAMVLARAERARSRAAEPVPSLPGLFAAFATRRRRGPTPVFVAST